MLYEKIENLQHNEVQKYRFLGEQSKFYSRSPQEMYHKAKRVAVHLQQQGTGKGDCIGLIIDEPEEFICGFMACIIAGAVPVPISPPNIGADMTIYSQFVSHIVNKSESHFLLVSEYLKQQLSESELYERLHLLSFTAMEQPTVDKLVLHQLTPQDACFIQFTSGSTGNPKGVVVSFENLHHNVHSIAKRINLTSDDQIVSWLPLHHDMGLIGKVLTPIYCQTHIAYISTRKFIRSPGIWLKALSDLKATITFAPNFAFSLTEKRYREKSDSSLDLSHLRVLGCGAEPVNSEVLDRFYGRMSKFGLRSESVMPCYGMAEATLALTFDSLDKPYKVIDIDKEQYQNFKMVVAPTSATNRQTLVSCGKIFEHHEIRIMDEHDCILGEDQVGEITVTGPSITSGYINNPTATHAAFDGQWLKTGDLGFLRDGELYVSGRIKDVIIINGRNIYPSDIEWQLVQVGGIREGNSVAISISHEHSESFVLLCEVRRPASDIIERIRDLCRRHIGLMPDDIVLLKSGTLPKTTSGKVRRQVAKAMYLASEFESLRIEVAEE